MPVKINCPRCNATMNMPESMYGKAVRCPSCKSPFQCPSAPPSARPAPAPSAPAARGGGSANPFAFEEPVVAATPAAGYDYEDPYAYRPRPRMRGWDAVAGGFVFLYISAACFYLAVLIPALLTEPPSPDTAKILVGGIMLLFTAGYVLGILGVARCNNAPHDSGAHGTAVTATVLLLVSGVLALFVFFLIILILFDAQVEVPPWLAAWSFMLQPGTLVAAWVLFLVFLMQGARAVKAQGVVAGTLGLLVVFLVIANLALTVMGPLGFMRVFLTLTMGRMAGGGGRPPRGGGMGMEDPSAGAEGELGKVVMILLPTIVLGWFILQLILAGSALRSRRSRGVA